MSSSTQSTGLATNAAHGGPIPLGPDSLTWQLGFPRSSVLIAGRALLLQVAHPVIGAGVRDFSSFKTDPWGRLNRSIESLETQLFGGPKSVEESAKLREMHKTIKGIGFHGERYSALMPEAWAWVHLSNLDSVLRFHQGAGPRLTAAQTRRLFGEWRQVGLVLGIKDSDMPTTIEELHGYVDGMIADRLEMNETVGDVLASLAMTNVGPPTPRIPASVWNAVKPVGRFALRDFTIGTLPAALRTKFGLTWTPRQQARLERAEKVVRTVSLAVPARAMQYPIAYEAVRQARAHKRNGAD